MTTLRPHEQLLAEGLLVEFADSGLALLTLVPYDAQVKIAQPSARVKGVTDTGCLLRRMTASHLRKLVREKVYQT